MKIKIVDGKKLTKQEASFILSAIFREFSTKLELADIKLARHFLLVSKQQIKAQCMLLNLEPIYFKGRRFDLLGLGSVIANKKNKGYGTLLIKSVLRYLKKTDQTLIGFCEKKNFAFYRKNGFCINTKIFKQFISIDDLFTNPLNNKTKYVIFIEGKDNLFKTMAKFPKEKALFNQFLHW